MTNFVTAVWCLTEVCFDEPDTIPDYKIDEKKEERGKSLNGANSKLLYYSHTHTVHS